MGTRVLARTLQAGDLTDFVSAALLAWGSVEIAQLAVYLGDDETVYMTGQACCIDGGVNF